MGSPGEVAAQSEAVITILTDGKAIDDVYNGPKGLLSGEVKGKLFIEMSTVPPKVETDLAPKVRGKGAALVECPVGGSTAPARKGQLLGLMGAEPADAARAKPILEQLCRKVEHCGPVGAAHKVKLINNFIALGVAAVVSEGFCAAAKAGVDLKALRGADANIKIAIAGIQGRGQAIGPIAFTALAKNGVITANLSQVALYGGDAKGLLKLDASGNALGLDPRRVALQRRDLRRQRFSLLHGGRQLRGHRRLGGGQVPLSVGRRVGVVVLELVALEAVHHDVARELTEQRSAT